MVGNRHPIVCPQQWMRQKNSEYASETLAQFHTGWNDFDLTRKFKSPTSSRLASATLLLGFTDVPTQCSVGVSSDVRKTGGLPVLCEPREPTFFSRWMFSTLNMLSLFMNKAELTQSLPRNQFVRSVKHMHAAKNQLSAYAADTAVADRVELTNFVRS